jgi:peptide/nickel transport system substrate-binding protein
MPVDGRVKPGHDGSGRMGNTCSTIRHAFVAAMLAAVCALPAAAQSLRIGLISDPDALDPTTSRTVSGRLVFTALCDKLIDIDEKLNFVPQLATQWSWAEDGKALTVKLRPGVKFHDGEALDAAAVKFSLERHLSMPGSTRKSELGPVAGVEIVDPLTVRLDLSAPFAPLVAALSDRSGMIVSPKAAQRLGDKFSTAPVCAGPFRFVERVQQDRIVVERFPEYWNAGAVHLDRVSFLPIPDAGVRGANLRAGGLEIAEGIAPADVPTLKADRRLKLEIGPSLASVYIAVNVAHTDRSKTPLARDARLREALDLAIDRKILNEVAFDGLYAPGNQTVPPGHPFYIRSLPVPERNVERAKKLIAEAGLQRLKIKLTVPNTSTYVQASQVLQSMVAEAGIDLELGVTEVATALKEWTAGEFEALIILWSGRTDIDANLYSFKACDGNLNGGKYCNPALDRALVAARTTNEPAKRYAAYVEAARIYLADRPYIYLWHPSLITAMTNRVEGFRLVPDSLIRFTGLKLMR